MKTLLVTNGTRPIIDHVQTGIKIRMHRYSKGVTMEETARRMGISASYLCDLELGRRHWCEALVARYQKAVK